MKRSNWNEQSHVEWDKEKLNKLFKSLRKEHIIARQNFSCCSSCGSYEIVEDFENMEQSKKQPIIGYTFYNRQSTESLERTGQVYLQYAGLNRKKDTTVGKKIVALATELNIKTEWDGNPSKCVLVDLTNK